MMELFQETVREVLEEKGGIPVVEEAAPDVLLVRAAILDLDITAPDDMSATRSRVFVSEVGSATLVAELYDSVSGEILVRVIYRKVARNNGPRFQISTSFINETEVRKAFREWSALLRDQLNGVREN